MPTNNTLIMMGLGLAALFMLRNRGGSEENQVDQLAGAAMMASGEGTTPDAPFQEYSAPANPIFFFNQGGQMAQVPGTNVPLGASSDEDIGIYPGGKNLPELEFTVARGPVPAGTTDISPAVPNFSQSGTLEVTPPSVWDEPGPIAAANFMPTLAIQDTGGGIEILGANVDISTLSSKETFRAENVGTGFGFHTTAEVLQEYVRGFTDSPPAPSGPTTVISQTAPTVVAPPMRPQPDWAIDQWWDEG
jgi:hypothetical protein